MVKSRHRIEFTLKQHTPLIHFQHDQPGATLRATELKPKLDRFLIRKEKILDDNGNVKKEYKRLFINNAKERKALDYKINIKAIKNHSYKMHYETITNRGKRKKNTFPEFFANIGLNSNIYYTFADEIRIEVRSIHERILTIIENNFQKFIFVHNFGMRQSKGFGSFTLERIDGRKIEPLFFGSYQFNIDINNEKLYTSYNFCEKIPNDYIKYLHLFEGIHRFHQSIRSGINERGFYLKPFIFHHAKDNGVTWDKKIFKENFLNNKTVDCQINKHHAYRDDPLMFTGESNYLVRDCLGLSTVQSWRRPPGQKGEDPCYREYGFTIRHPKDDKTDSYEDEEINPNTIKRFKSPITYKPICHADGTSSVYLIIDDFPEKFKDENTSPDFTIVKEKNGNIQGIIENMRMWKDFDPEDFLHFVYNKRDGLEKMANKTNHFIYKLLDTIYQSLEKVES